MYYELIILLQRGHGMGYETQETVRVIREDSLDWMPMCWSDQYVARVFGGTFRFACIRLNIVARELLHTILGELWTD